TSGADAPAKFPSHLRRRESPFAFKMDGEADHVHLLVAYPPKLAVSVLVNNLKSISSRQIRILNTHLRKQSNSGLLWSRSYFACSAGGATIETLKAYVASQNTPD
ncbi:IS200/IS605 family transposase, partial [Aeromonas caviae]